MENFAFLNGLIENLKIASVFILDKNGMIVNINQGVTKTFGYKNEDLSGKYFGILFCNEDVIKQKPEFELATVFEKGEATDFNYILHKSGAKIWVNGESALAESETGDQFILKLVYDANEQKVLEEFLFQQNRFLLRANNDLNTFVYTASHDLKAPIGNIEALLDYLKDELPEDVKSQEKIISVMEMLHVSIDRFKNTLDDLSATGKAVAENFDNQRLTYFHELFEDVETNLYEMIQRYNPIISTDFTRAPYIHFSRKNLRSILQNLLSNALKFSSVSRRPEIEITTLKKEGRILLKVSDNGLGIKPEDQEKIFSMYERAHQHIEGTGVGLNIIQRIMDNSGGRIEVDSHPGEGTTFLLYFKYEDLPIQP